MVALGYRRIDGGIVSETVGQWKERKRAQGLRFVSAYPHLVLDDHGDYRTRFVLVETNTSRALRYGQIRRGNWSDGVDLSDEEIKAWLACEGLATATVQ